MNKYFLNKNGFTLVEMLVVMSVFGLIGSAATLMLKGTRNSVTLEDAQATVLNALEKARSRASTGVGSGNHGVIINGNVISECEGNPCTETSNTTLKLPTDKSGLTIMFNRLSATSSVATTITILAPGENATVTVNENGIIEK